MYMFDGPNSFEREMRLRRQKEPRLTRFTGSDRPAGEIQQFYCRAGSCNFCRHLTPSGVLFAAQNSIWNRRT